MFLNYYYELTVDCVHWLVETVENGNKSSDLKICVTFLSVWGNDTFSNMTLLYGVSYLVS
jgi:hypothetical protein